MRRLSWCDSTKAAAARPPIRVERFCGKSRWKVHLLGELKCKRVHYRLGENTAPCLDPEPCPLCADPLWKPRLEFFAPALVQDVKACRWVPIVAVFTQGAFNQLHGGPPRPWRGRVLDVWRKPQGTASVLAVKELQVVEPTVPAFDVEGVLIRLWFPSEKDVPPVTVPEPVEYVVERQQRPTPEPTKAPPEAAAALSAYLRRLNKEKEAAESARPADEAVDAVLTRYPLGGQGLQYGQRVEVRPALTPESEAEALTKGTGEIVCGEVKESLNGRHPAKKGGAK